MDKRPLPNCVPGYPLNTFATLGGQNYSLHSCSRPRPTCRRSHTCRCSIQGLPEVLRPPAQGAELETYVGNATPGHEKLNTFLTRTIRSITSIFPPDATLVQGLPLWPIAELFNSDGTDVQCL